MKKLLAIIAICLLVSCKTTKTVEVPVDTKETHTEYIVKDNRDTVNIRDSIYLRDSIYIKDKGDTIFYYNTKVQYKYKTEYKYKDRTDTLVVRDTIPQTITLTKEVVKEVNNIYWWQKILMWLGGLVSLTSLGYLILKIKKKL